MYSQEYMRHFSNPENVGELKGADAVADVHYTGQGCFDRVRIFMKKKNRKIDQVTYQTRGCSGTIAACSAMSELAAGMNLSEAAGIRGEDIADALGGIPERKQHSMDLAAEALRTVTAKLLET